MIWNVPLTLRVPLLVTVAPVASVPVIVAVAPELIVVFAVKVAVLVDATVNPLVHVMLLPEIVEVPLKFIDSEAELLVSVPLLLIFPVIEIGVVDVAKLKVPLVTVMLLIVVVVELVSVSVKVTFDELRVSVPFIVEVLVPL